jgi:hypothetical protein
VILQARFGAFCFCCRRCWTESWIAWEHCASATSLVHVSHHHNGSKQKGTRTTTNSNKRRNTRRYLVDAMSDRTQPSFDMDPPSASSAAAMIGANEHQEDDAEGGVSGMVADQATSTRPAPLAVAPPLVLSQQRHDLPAASGAAGGPPTFFKYDQVSTTGGGTLLPFAEAVYVSHSAIAIEQEQEQQHLRSEQEKLNLQAVELERQRVELERQSVELERQRVTMQQQQQQQQPPQPAGASNGLFSSFLSNKKRWMLTLGIVVVVLALATIAGVCSGGRCYFLNI